MGQQLIIREAMEEDEIMLRCIYNACMEREPWASDYRLYTEKAMHSFFEEKKEKGYPVLVAVMGGPSGGIYFSKAIYRVEDGGERLGIWRLCGWDLSENGRSYSAAGISLH